MKECLKIGIGNLFIFCELCGLKKTEMRSLHILFILGAVTWLGFPLRATGN
ncbi:hypothetical protein [Bacteroides fluxus]|uniref:Uncharacterized protein n=1 Tax=Bacteroides fluxus YIT 12057 TaxID=763034 RepID=F3PRC8_9BACE|nr:hypothetical protein [Bacteroides fluxus]EGF58476.1 hypothetical protein HMPREF9446_01277 [Bacteroides fluxus YIT 12057]MDY3790157.1 hypothetical protein [Bacteroides fluxus]